LVLVPSSHEGFGLPVLEALVRQQVPVVTPDPALIETAAGMATVARGWGDSAFAQAIAEAVDRVDSRADEIRVAAVYAREWTWERTWSDLTALVMGSTGWRCNHCA
jgi:glycosyltransferase involved in cell wall biosynthesis